MGRLTTQAVATTTTELTLTPKLQKRLRAELAEYAKLDAAYQQAAEEREAKNADIEELRKQIGETSVGFEGATITRVGGTTSSLNKQKFVELGGSLAMLENATEHKPKKPHTKITLPKKRD